MRVAIIINPLSGPRRVAGHGARAARLAGECLQARAIEGRIHLTAYAGHARQIAAEEAARGTEVVVAWGGDGTVNEVGAGLAFSSTALAIVPAGSGNGFGRALGLPRSPADALAVALDGATRTIDVGELGGRLFFNVAGLGLDAAIAHRFSLEPRRRGLRAYVRLAAAELWRYRPERYVLAGDGFRHEGTALIVAIANSPQYGNGAIIAPGARIDDGELDLVVVAPASRLRNMIRARRLFDGTLYRDPGVWRRRTRALRVEGAGSLRFHVDGEPHLGAARLEARIHPRALGVRVGLSPEGVRPASPLPPRGAC
jgi:diacylglycerol kinase (ATP)